MAFITINKANFYHNLNQIALQTGSLEKIAIVFKDNAYGHGITLMAKLAAEYGVKQAVVRTLEEADRIRTFFENILILGDTIIVDKKYSFAINSLEDIPKAQKGAKIELKVDTGMHRNGIALEELASALKSIKEKGLELVGLMTHYRSADLLSSEFFWQKQNFLLAKEAVKKAGFSNVRFHSHNSAGILRNKHFDEDLVRVGIAAYGYNELEEPLDKILLKPVLSLEAKKVATRLLKKDQGLGYGADFVAAKDMQVSTYDVGYGDGWQRGTYTKPYTTQEGLAILGRVSMDFISLASKKEEICLMSDAQIAAKHFGTISYEILTALDADIERIVI